VAAATAAALAALIALLSVSTAPIIQRRLPDGSVAVPVEPAPSPRPLPRGKPLVIAHRGASAYMPEHTIGAYRLAATMGADYIEADLVVTRDGQLVARHESELSLSTDVTEHPEFADRRTTQGGVTGWFTEDFTLDEIRTLHTRARRAGSPPFDETVPTLQEIIDLAVDRQVGLYLELKSPSYFASRGLAPEPLLADTLRRNHLARRASPVFVESFEADSLRAVHRLVDVPIVQLLWGDAPAQLDDVRKYAVGIGIDRTRLRGLVCAPRNEGLGTANVVELAHRAGLEVHVYTFANDTAQGPFLAAAYEHDDPPTLAGPLAEYRAYFRLGIDGVFTDNPDVARRAVRR